MHNLMDTTSSRRYNGCSSLMIIVIAFFFFFLCSSTSHSAVVIGNGHRCIEKERRALLAIKQDIYQPPPPQDEDNLNNWLSSWTTTSDCCNWLGVVCDNQTNHVTELHLRYPYQYYYDGISWFGIIPGPSKLNPSLVDLMHLKYLDLSMNNFYGSPIPEFIGSLVKLDYLNLSQAGFGGTIPPQIGNLSNLRFLDLSVDPFIEYSLIIYSLSAGENLGWLSHFPSLEYLDMTGVNLSMASDQWIHQVNMLPSLSVLILEYVGLDVGISTNLDHINLTSLTKLDLSGNQFNAVPNWFFNLSSLVHLDLEECFLQDEFGEVPNWLFNAELPEIIGNLNRLQHLDLSYNNITGELPNSIGNLVKLQRLNLGGNKISGELPQTISNLSNLQELNLGSNNIGGQLPAAAIGSLCNLDTLTLSSNSIGGEVTALIDGLSRCIQNMNMESYQYGLTFLDLSQNEFNGTIPESLGQLSSLTELYLSSNSFTGRLTEAHFSKLSNLNVLELSYNQKVEVAFVNESWVPPFNAHAIGMCSCHLGPKFPAWLQTQTNLEYLCVSEAGISDNIPSWLGNLTNMHSLNASHNQMRGQLPPSTNAGGLLDLSYNLFDGHIPLCFITNQPIEFLSLSHNRLGGSIPLDLFNLTALKVLDLSYNNFSGPFPLLYQNSQSSLQVLDLSNNNLSGQIPAAIGFYASLQSLHLENNHLTGEIPRSLKHCDQLVVLDIGENGLTGNIPDWIGESLLQLRVLRLRANFFCGSIPEQLSNLTQLQVLDLAHNNLSSILPPSFGNFGAMSTVMSLNTPMTDGNFSYYYTESIIINAKGEAYEYSRILSLVLSMDLSGNSIYGEIPEELTRLLGLVFLNLSGNHFTGKIPENIGAMKQLESLDLSINNLSGTIPSSISSLAFLSSFNLSCNKLSGKIPSGGQLSTFDSTTYGDNLALCGLPLPLCLADEPTQVPPPPQAEDEDESEDKTEIIELCISIALGFITGFWGIMITLRITHFRLTDKINDYLYVKIALYFARVKYMIVNDNR